MNKLIKKYLQSCSTLEHSTTYRACSKIFSYVDRLWDRLYEFSVKTGETSLVMSFVRKTFCKANSPIAYSLFILFFSCGFAVTSILLGNFNSIKAILLVLGILTSTLLLVDRYSWSVGLKGSLFWRIAIYLFD